MALGSMLSWLIVLGGCLGILFLLLLVAGLFMRSATLGDERSPNYFDELRRNGRFDQ